MRAWQQVTRWIPGRAGSRNRRKRQDRRGRRWRLAARRVGVGGLALLGCLVLLAGGGWVALVAAGSGTPARAAHGTGNDALWLGHAWVDGRKQQSDVDALAEQLRTTGIHDLFVHSGPLRDDGTLDPALLPQARWLAGALHTAMPGVRVQAWLGAHPVPEELRLDSATTRAAVLTAAAQVLDDGFDGVHYDFEPVVDGDRDLLTMLRQTRELTRRRGALLSVSAIHTQPVSGLAPAVRLLPGRLALWSDDYLRAVAVEVDQVALMAYDTALPDQASFRGYLRLVTERALAAVPADVTLFIGVPAYHDEHAFHHRSAETVAAAVRGVRLGLGPHPPRRTVGVAMYVDFAATPHDWDSYREGWADLRPAR